MQPSASNVPDMTRGGALRSASGGVHLTGEPVSRNAPQFVAVPPPQAMGPTRGNDGRKQRVVGLVPAVAGSTFALVVRDRPAVRVTPREIGLIKAELRKADAAVRQSEAGLVDATLMHGAESDIAKAKLSESRMAVDRAAIFRRRLADAEQQSIGRPTQVHMATVHEPSEVPDALGDVDTPPVVVCLHDGCKGHRWADEREMRMAHPTNAEMQRTQQAHVFVYLSDAPADPLDPDGQKIGYIAPIGRDGTTVGQVAAMAEEGTAARAEDVEGLTARVEAQDRRIADLLALVEALSKGPKK